MPCAWCCPLCPHVQVLPLVHGRACASPGPCVVPAEECSGSPTCRRLTLCSIASWLSFLPICRMVFCQGASPWKKSLFSPKQKWWGEVIPYWMGRQHPGAGCEPPHMMGSLVCPEGSHHTRTWQTWQVSPWELKQHFTDLSGFYGIYEYNLIWGLYSPI